MSLNDVTTGIGSLAIRILHRQDADDEDAVRWFPRQLVDVENVSYVMWKDGATGDWRTGTRLECFDYRGRAYLYVKPDMGNISMKALLWDEVRYVL
jgi:hypothetical protein